MVIIMVAIITKVLEILIVGVKYWSYLTMVLKNIQNNKYDNY